LEIWPMRKHAILNNNINILSRELRMEQKKWVDENQEKKNDELSVSPCSFIVPFSHNFPKFLGNPTCLKNLVQLHQPFSFSNFKPTFLITWNIICFSTFQKFYDILHMLAYGGSGLLLKMCT
jgi:hypothetical protein